MPGILRLAPLEGEKAQSSRKAAARPYKMTDRLKRVKNVNEQPKRVPVEESTRRRERPPVTSSLRRTMETHKHGSSDTAVRHQHQSDERKSNTGTNTKQRASKRTLRTASYQTQTAMPSRDRSLAALAALHSSYKSASSLAMDSNDISICASAWAPADDMVIGSLQDKLMALAGRETTNTNTAKEQQRKTRSNSLDSGRDASLKGVSARKPRAMAQATSSTTRRDLQRQILEDMRTKHQSARMRKIEPIGSRRAIVQPGSNRGIRYKASCSSSSNASAKPSSGHACSPKPAKNTNETSRKKSDKKTVPKPTNKRTFFRFRDAIVLVKTPRAARVLPLLLRYGPRWKRDMVARGRTHRQYKLELSNTTELHCRMFLDETSSELQWRRYKRPYTV